MNQSSLIKMLIFIVVVIIGVVSFLIIKLVNPNFFSSFEHIDNNKTNQKEFSEKDIEDSINKREERIKALKEVGKKLGG